MNKWNTYLLSSLLALFCLSCIERYVVPEINSKGLIKVNENGGLSLAKTKDLEEARNKWSEIIKETKGYEKPKTPNKIDGYLQIVSGGGIGISVAVLFIGMYFTFAPFIGVPGSPFKGVVIVVAAISSAGMCYMLSKYILWIVLVVILLFVISFAYLIFFNREFMHKLMLSFDAQKDVRREEDPQRWKEVVKSTQGKMQPHIKKLKDRVNKKTTKTK